MTSTELISQEVEKLIQTLKNSYEGVKRVAVAEAWKVLQTAVATIVQIIESIGNDLSSPEKKALALHLLSNLYDKVFMVVDIPLIPHMLESILHKHVKNFLMVLVSSTIDSMVTIFRSTGVFQPKLQVEGE